MNDTSNDIIAACAAEHSAIEAICLAEGFKPEQGEVYERAFRAVSAGVGLGRGKEERGWIAVEERVPELDIIVLAFKPERWERPYDFVKYTQRSEDHRKYMIWAIGPGNKSGCPSDGQWWDDGYQITHWRPRPEPPVASAIRGKGTSHE